MGYGTCTGVRECPVAGEDAVSWAVVLVCVRGVASWAPLSGRLAVAVPLWGPLACAAPLSGRVLGAIIADPVGVGAMMNVFFSVVEGRGGEAAASAVRQYDSAAASGSHSEEWDLEWLVIGAVVS